VQVISGSTAATSAASASSARVRLSQAAIAPSATVTVSSMPRLFARPLARRALRACRVSRLPLRRHRPSRPTRLRNGSRRLALRRRGRQLIPQAKYGKMRPTRPRIGLRLPPHRRNGTQPRQVLKRGLTPHRRTTWQIQQQRRSA
jgi:hypothetical protein